MATEPPQGSLPEPVGRTSDSFPHGEFLRDIAREWNKAEAAIKRSEQIVGDLSIPAISELRYAGRRLIDALDASHHGGSPAKINALLEDARFCCHRAQHDAIDAALAKIGADLDNMTARLGFDAVIHAYPDFRLLFTDFSLAQQKVAGSRENREGRKEIYETITAIDMPKIIDQYLKLKAASPIAKDAALRLRLGGWIGVATLLATIAAAVFAGLAVDWSKYDPSQAAPTANQRATQPGKS
jgi:hypothetical protein